MENAQKKGSRVGILDELRGFAIICKSGSPPLTVMPPLSPQ